MMLTRRRKIMVLICVVALVALIGDRLQLASSGIGPVSAAASGLADEYAVKIDLDGGSDRVLAKAPARPDSALANRLDKFTDRNALAAVSKRDAFRPSPAWLSEIVGPPPVAPVAEDPAKSAAKDFAEEHTLNAVLLGPGGDSAIVDHRCLKIGEKLGDYRLLSVDDRSAVFRAGSVRVTLSLATAPLGDSER